MISAYSSYIKLGIASLLPVLAALLLYILENKTPFGKLKYIVKQIIIGVVFGGLAIIGTEWGIPINGAQVNCRDAAVLISGLMFGAPAGIIAGVLGGVERWFAVFWGVGTYTRIACSVSTVIAGLYSALLRKYMFENKKPGTILSLAIGIIMEVFHLTMVFITNMSDPEKAMSVVQSCTFPMVIANGLSVMLAAFVLNLISLKKRKRSKKSNVRISQTIQRWLMVTVLLAFVTTSYFVFTLQDELAKVQTVSLMQTVRKDILNDIERCENDLDIIKSMAVNRSVGKQNGFLLILDDNNNILSAPDISEADLDKTDILNLKKDIAASSANYEGKGNEPNPQEQAFKVSITLKDGTEKKYFLLAGSANGYKVVTFVPFENAYELRNIALYVNTFMEILVFAVLFGLIYLLIKKVVVNNINTINRSLAKITCGDLDEVVNVRSSQEFASLSDDINSTVETLKRYIDEASARIDAELEFAKNIQISSLPNVFPAFPKRKDFDIYASMCTAKEVGGDFYDFYMSESNRLNFLIADVSGKGIPAAMFMMRAKTELKTLTESALPINDVFTKGNTALCEGNDAGMFVTAWQGGIDLKTGLVHFANAGHNPPLVKRGDGPFEYLKSRAGFVLAGMEGVKYKPQELQLEVGDILFLYTDGVTEATDANNELYGEERLLNALNSREFDDMHSLCDYVKADVDAFVKDAPQFDDITMLAFKYIGAPAKAIHFDNAVLSDIPVATEFIENELLRLNCKKKAIVELKIVIDEMFSNIIKFAYKGETGPVTIRLLVKEDYESVYLNFIDEGIPYNPLIKDDPDITLSADDRDIGGLGIFMVKNMVDDAKYKYENGHNMFTVHKTIKDPEENS